MKLCSRFLIVYGRNFCEKRQIWVNEPHFEEVRGDVWPWLMARWEPMVDFLFALIEFFSLSITVPELWGQMFTAWLFSQGDLIYTQILHRHGRPPLTILGSRKLKTLGYPMVKTASLCIPSFWHNTVVWRTDRRTDGFAVAQRKLALRRAVRWQLNRLSLTSVITRQ